MMRQVSAFFIFGIIGLGVQATLFHSTFPEFPAPDLILVLVVGISRLYHTRMGLFGAFCMGLLADFASAQYLGPNAAGCVVAFLFVGLIANRMYADKVIAMIFIAAGSSMVKSLMALLMYFLYLPDFTIPPHSLRTVLLEAILSAILAPFVLRVLRINIPSSSFGQPRMPTAPSYRWSS